MIIKRLQLKIVLLISLNILTAAAEDCDSITCKLIALYEAATKPVEDKPYPIKEHITNLGYPFESHEIQTEDGYLLTLHRIPYGREQPPPASLGPPVLLQHGLFSASPVWVPEKDRLGFLLADAGYDVWLANWRGNSYSRGHIKYDYNKDKEYFDFSWHEKGYYDLPASIDYILGVTHRSQLVFVGHSIGCTTYLVMGATRPEYMSKVKVAILLGPIANPKHYVSPFAELMKDVLPGIKVISESRGEHQFLENTPHIVTRLCEEKQFQGICNELMFYLEGVDKQEKTKDVISSGVFFMLNGATFKELEHLRQVSGKHTSFTQFDYGKKKNIEVYKSIKPPKYNLANAKAPIIIYYGKNDSFAMPKDIQRLIKRLPNVQALIEMPDEFKHKDFLWSLDAKTLLYDDIIARINALKD